MSVNGNAFDFVSLSSRQMHLTLTKTSDENEKEKSKRKSKNNSSCREPFRRILFHSENNYKRLRFRAFCAGSRIDVNRINVYFLQHYNQVHSPLCCLRWNGVALILRWRCRSGMHRRRKLCCLLLLPVVVFSHKCRQLFVLTLSHLSYCVTQESSCVFLHFVYIKSNSLTQCV